MNKILKCEKGATTIEYILIASLIAVVIIASLMFLGQETKEVFMSTGDRLFIANQEASGDYNAALHDAIKESHGWEGAKNKNINNIGSSSNKATSGLQSSGLKIGKGDIVLVSYKSGSWQDWQGAVSSNGFDTGYSTRNSKNNLANGVLFTGATIKGADGSFSDIVTAYENDTQLNDAAKTKYGVSGPAFTFEAQSSGELYTGAVEANWGSGKWTNVDGQKIGNEGWYVQNGKWVSNNLGGVEVEISIVRGKEVKIIRDENGKPIDFEY